MKFQIILGMASMLLVTSANAITERMCFGQVQVDTTSELVAKISVVENDRFKDKKCTKFFHYYEGKVNFDQASCNANSEQIALDKGYAPFGVFFRGWESTPKTGISKYEWKISGPIKDGGSSPVLAKFTSFNAAYVFEEPGKYTASLTITDEAGNTDTTIKEITVWDNNKDYYVDSELGDDRYDGLSRVPSKNCSPSNSKIGSCSGPWKTATKAFGEINPFNVSDYPNGKYKADGICKTKDTVRVAPYEFNLGHYEYKLAKIPLHYKIFKNSPYLKSEVMKDSNGNLLPPVDADICTSLVAKRQSVLKPGDQVLFKRGQQFDVETGYSTIKAYKDKLGDYYERLEVSPLLRFNHWSKINGIHFSTFGSGEKPVIKNVGKVSSSLLGIIGVGVMDIAFSDLKFDLETENTPFYNRATLLFSSSDPQNIIFNRVNVENMKEGIIASTIDAKGLFLVDSKFYDSSVVMLYAAHSYKDIAMIRTKLDYSASHLFYSSIDSGLFLDNEFTRPAFGRPAYRLYGGKHSNPNRFVWFENNKFIGWVDPRTADGGGVFSNGKRYNSKIVHLGPNGWGEQRLATHDVVFKNNIVKDGETLMMVGDLENLTISGNQFISHDEYYAHRIILNQKLSSRPLKNITIDNNVFIEKTINQTRGVKLGIIQLKNYFQTKCSDQFNNEDIKISNNTFYLPTGRHVFSYYPLKQGKDLQKRELPDLSLDQAEKILEKTVSLINNKVFSAKPYDTLVQVGGDFWAKTLKDGTAEKIVSKLDSSIGASEYYEGKTQLGNNFRFYTMDSNLTSDLATTKWKDVKTVSVDNILKGVTRVASKVALNDNSWTWNDVQTFGDENGISPDEVGEAMMNSMVSSTDAGDEMQGHVVEEKSWVEIFVTWWNSLFE
ncbi:MAG: PKD domain-containing protein [Methylococcaceae bacterium]|nr:PKD domain-containing protein [Methylococcaceae bacterium]